MKSICPECGGAGYVFGFDTNPPCPSCSVDAACELQRLKEREALLLQLLQCFYNSSTDGLMWSFVGGVRDALGKETERRLYEIHKAIGTTTDRHKP